MTNTDQATSQVISPQSSVISPFDRCHGSETGQPGTKNQEPETPPSSIFFFGDGTIIVGMGVANGEDFHPRYNRLPAVELAARLVEDGIAWEAIPERIGLPSFAFITATATARQAAK